MNVIQPYKTHHPQQVSSSYSRYRDISYDGKMPMTFPNIRNRKILSLSASLFVLAFAVWGLTAVVQKGSILSMFRLLSPLERSEAWREDLRFLARRMQQVHPNLFFALSEQGFEDALSDLEAKLPQLSDEQIIVELVKLVALPGVTGGRDGHSYVPVFQEATGFHALPLRLHKFSDGWFVVDAQEPYQELIGKRLVQIGELGIDEASAILSPLISRDNDMTVKARLGTFLLIPDLLQATGVIGNADGVKLVMEGGDQKRLTTTVQPIAGEAYETWEESWRRPENFLFDYLEPSRTLYIQYNAVRAKTASGETLKQFSNRIAAFVEEHPVEQVVVDIRQNGGGNNYTYRPLLKLLTENEAVNQPGKLFVLTGRDTFSAAGNFATELERNSNALFVGEPMGGGLNQYGDNRSFTLPNSGLEVKIASKYWQISDADDERLTLTPDIEVEPSSTDFFAERDPALAAILAYE